MQSKKQYNDKLLANLQAERSMAIASRNLERIEVLESAIKQHNKMAETDSEEERMSALRGECGMESRK